LLQQQQQQLTLQQQQSAKPSCPPSLGGGSKKQQETSPKRKPNLWVIIVTSLGVISPAAFGCVQALFCALEALLTIQQLNSILFYSLNNRFAASGEKEEEVLKAVVLQVCTRVLTGKQFLKEHPENAQQILALCKGVYPALDWHLGGKATAAASRPSTPGGGGDVDADSADSDAK
jgi:hypothetical protein